MKRPNKTALTYTIEHLPAVSSTQDIARRLAERHAPEGAVLVAEIQTAGRGRWGRAWVSPFGGLWFSLLLRPRVSPAAASCLSLLAAAAIAGAIRDATGLPAGIKWPNDIMIEERKLAGALIEMKTGPAGVDYVLVGVGVNVNIDPVIMPRNLRLPAATILGETGRAMELDGLLDQILAEFKAAYDAWPNNQREVLSRWRALSVTLERRVNVAGSGPVLAGVARDIDSNGALLVVDDAGIVHSIHAGDVTLSFD